MRAALKRLVPGPVKAIGRAGASLVVFSNPGSLRRYQWCRERGPLPEGRPRVVDVQVRQLGGATVSIRTVGSDARVLFDAFVHQYHLPPPSVADAIAARSRAGNPCIVDLGANIGLTMAHYAYLYPKARIVGVELDAENAMMCRHNVAAWADRCTVVQAAVWTEDGAIEYDVQPEAQYAMAARAAGTVQGTMARSAKAISLDTLLARHLPQQTVDFMKMDVEGAERALLSSAGEWVAQVHAMKVEVHAGYTTAMCVRDLERLGFDARPDVERAHCVIGVRRR